MSKTRTRVKTKSKAKPTAKKTTVKKTTKKTIKKVAATKKSPKKIAAKKAGSKKILAKKRTKTIKKVVVKKKKDEHVQPMKPMTLQEIFASLHDKMMQDQQNIKSHEHRTQNFNPNFQFQKNRAQQSSRVPRTMHHSRGK